jgi:DNA-binding LacI/PurR family transcriptional regulator
MKKSEFEEATTASLSTTTLLRPGAARLEDIAARVGVSRSEVSRVLNNRQREGRSVGRAKQEEIWRVARELNYQPHRTAQNLARGRTDTVGLVVRLDSTRELTPHYHEIVGALTYTLNEWGLNLLLVQCDVEDPAPCLEKLARARTCDAVILTDMQVDDPRPTLLEELGQSFIIRGSAPRPGLTAVGMDNFAVGYKAVEFLRRFGHRRILFHNIGRGFMAGKGRYEGFQSAAKEFGLLDDVRYEEEVYREEDMYNLTRRLMREPNPPTAIFAADEMAAFGVFRGLADAGVRVPEDVSVLTCLNARFMRRVNPRMSVINVRQEEVASEAGRTLARMLRGEPVEARQTFLTPILEEHGSCAPPSRD